MDDGGVAEGLNDADSIYQRTGRMFCAEPLRLEKKVILFFPGEHLGTPDPLIAMTSFSMVSR